MNGCTVKRFLTVLEEMRTIYPFDEEKTKVSINHNHMNLEEHLWVATTDERTGVVIEMTKTLWTRREDNDE